MKKCVGILGGMGPLASKDLFHKIISMTQASTDQDHIHIILDSDTNIPDRTQAILHGGEDPLPELVASAQRLEHAGAELLLIACNTAHYYYERIAPNVCVPILHMPQETAMEVNRLGFSRVGFLGTDATVRLGMYHRILAEQRIEVINPSPDGQSYLMRLIYEGVKANDFSFNIAPMIEELKAMQQQGAQAFILGCTELPIAFSRYALSFPAIDPTAVLAAAAIRAAGGRLCGADL